jgi:hypothetical protein
LSLAGGGGLLPCWQETSPSKTAKIKKQAFMRFCSSLA